MPQGVGPSVGLLDDDDEPCALAWRDRLLEAEDGSAALLQVAGAVVDRPAGLRVVIEDIRRVEVFLGEVGGRPFEWHGDGFARIVLRGLENPE